MRKFFARLIIMTLALAAFGFIAFAYVGDLSPTRENVSQSVALSVE